MIQDAQNLLATTLAACSNFQSFVGAADTAAALARIHHDYLPNPDGDRYTAAELADIRPCALIYTQPADGFTYQRDATGTDCWTGFGRLVCVLMRDTPADMTDSELDVDMRTKAGSIMSDLVDLSESAGYLAVNRLGGSGPYRTDPDELKELGDRQAFEITIEWGHRP